MKQKSYPIHQSPLYKLGSKRRLALLLGCSVRDLLTVASAQDNYLLWPTRQKAAEAIVRLPHKPRDIQQPKPKLARIQKRLADLVSRIERPEYLYSATRGRNYIKNALFHQGCGAILKVDVKSFYANVSPGAVRRFYENDLKCSSDVARLLTRLSMFDDRMLPTGSALSPIVSFFSHKRMFDRISALATKFGAKFSLYVDDIVISGHGVTREHAAAVCSELARHGLVGHKVSFIDRGKPRVVTGVALVGERVDLPHKRWKKIRILEEAFSGLEHQPDRQVVASALVGQYREAAGIIPGIQRKADGVLKRVRQISRGHD